MIEVGTVLRLDAVERGFVELQTHDYLEYLFTVLDGPQAGTCYVIAVTTESMPPGRPGERWHYADQTLYPANLVPVPESTIPDWDRRIEPVKRPVVVIEPTPVQITFAQADCDAVEAAFGRPLGGFWPGHLSVRGEPVVDVSLAKALDLLEKLRRQHVLATGIRFPDWMPPRDAEALLAAAGTSARRIPAVGSRRPRDGVAAAIRRWLAS